MGHSRGGYLTSYYSMRHPEKIDYAVNMNGGWSTACESKSRQTYSTLKESGQKFKRQIWLYATHDKYFSEMH
jgi:pimeloyl-ACP methyl ester carboxylesterase